MAIRVLVVVGNVTVVVVAVLVDLDSDAGVLRQRRREGCLYLSGFGCVDADASNSYRGRSYVKRTGGKGN